MDILIDVWTGTLDADVSSRRKLAGEFYDPVAATSGDRSKR
jgi:hypothetical protein